VFVENLLSHIRTLYGECSLLLVANLELSMRSGVELPLSSAKANHLQKHSLGRLSLRAIIILVTRAYLCSIAPFSQVCAATAYSPSTPMQAFSAKPFVQQALRKVCHPTSVLSFWFGVDLTMTSGRECLRNGSNQCLRDMAALWYGGGPEFDGLCQPFADVVHMAGTKTLPKEDGWYSTTDGYVAQVVLIDQLARNVFRGTQDAFRYEMVALDIARELSTKYLQQHPESSCAATAESAQLLPSMENVAEDLYPPYCSLIATALMHSETPSDHSLCISLIEHSMQLAQKGIVEPDESTKLLYNWFQNQLKFAYDHKAVIDRFGRYPHRNRLYNRTSTQEELDWLSDTDSLPGWAKSQG
jgi:uncharacterized protein (DUF924 family)